MISAFLCTGKEHILGVCRELKVSGICQRLMPVIFLSKTRRFDTRRMMDRIRRKQTGNQPEVSLSQQQFYY